MTDKRRQAFIAWCKSPASAFMANGGCSIEEAWQIWQAACAWMIQPPQPSDGALVLDGKFFKRDNR